MKCIIKRLAATAVAVLWGLGTLSAHAADNASGTVTYKARSATFKYAYLIKGPDAVDPKVTIRELILTANDIGAKLNACKTMSCASGLVEEGMTVDFGAGPRLNYWLALNNQMVQYSGTAVPAVFTAKQNDAARLAGTLRIDAAAAGGPRVDVEFDVGLTKEFAAAR
ncbi:MAG TPA: hypothetical protein VLJ57_08060 [Burkholderiaceae bacterium]|nr:hypothetical protein [Burkholderiaceae bacterium]